VIKKKVHENARKAAKTLWMMNCAKMNDCILWITAMAKWASTERQRFLVIRPGNNTSDWLYSVTKEFLAAFMGKTDSNTLLPHHENERQRSVNYFWSCVLGNHTSDRLYSVIKEFLAAFLGKTDSNTLLPHRENERQVSVNDFSHASWKWHLRYGVLSHKGIFGCLYRQNRLQYPPCPSWKWASTERQRLLVMYHG